MTRRICFFVALLLLAGVSGTDSVLANPNWPPAESVTDLSDPQHWPSDTSYDDMWELYSFIPTEAVSKVRKAEIPMGSGIHADRAWQKTIGDGRVVIAVLDSGIRWRERDLVNKHYLNAGELPTPHADCRAPGFNPEKPYDANADGIFNIQDYAKEKGHAEPTNPCDPRIIGFAAGWDTNGNQILDPQDLIQIFSDGKDDDNNGYTDDISGWDFHDNDNDPNDDTNYGHGSGEASSAAAEANNAREEIGVCPLCPVLSVRVGDSYIADANIFALGVAFAVDSGASVILEALGALNNSTFAIDAINYAYDSGVVIIGSAADENAFHANLPAANHRIVYTHAITHDGSKVSTSTTFLNFNNCSNYGPRLELSTPTPTCSSEATGITAGLSGLIYSAALKADIPFPTGSKGATDKHGTRRLTAEEVRQLLITNVDDINIPEAKDDPTKYPSREGWEQRFGFGRPNAARIVEAVLAGKIPPEVDLIAPDWFEVVYPERTPTLTIKGRLGFRKDRYQSMDYVVDWAPGADPEPSAFKTLVEKNNVTDAIDGTIYEWDVSKVTVDNPEMPAPDRTANRRMATLRVRVTAHSSTLGDVIGQTRKAIHFERDPDLLPGFPVRIVASGESSPKTADIDGDGKREIVLITPDGKVEVIDGEGKPLPGWPARLERVAALDSDHAANVLGAHSYSSGAVSPERYTSSSSFGPPAIGDLDGDGSIEVVASSLDGAVFAYNAEGKVRSGFPVTVEKLDLDKVSDRDNIIDQGIVAAVVLADLDGDKKLEIIAAGMDGKLYVWREDGSPQDGFPVQLKAEGADGLARIVSSPAVGDIDGDGTPDIVVGTNELLDNFGALYVVHGEGNAHSSGNPYHEGWPARIISIEIFPFVGEGMPNAPALADLNGDGLPEIGIAGVGAAVVVLRNTGEQKIPACFSTEDVEIGAPGWEKLVVPCTRKITKTCAEEEAADKKFRCLTGAMNNSKFGEKSDAADRPSVGLVVHGSFGDINNDGVIDLVMPLAGFGVVKSISASGVRADYEHQVGAWSTLTASFLPGFPRRTDDWQFFHNPSIADIDGDYRPEVLGASAGYWVHAWNADGEEPAGWPKLTGQWNVGSPAVGDITGDGNLEVIISTRSGWLYAWKTTGSAKGRIDWESYGHDNHNTRNFGTKLEQGIPASEIPEGVIDGGPEGDGGPSGDGGPGSDGGDGGDEGGGGCSCELTTSPPASAVLWLLLLGLLLRRRQS